MQGQATICWSLDQVENMILSLYQQTSARVISTNQAHLTRFQASAEAWSMVQDLLERPDDKVRFFGALTLIIKLNRESFSLGEDNARELLVRLVSWYLDSLAGASGSLVSRKLSSAIATHFIHFYRLWPRFVRHLIYCLASCRLSYDTLMVEQLSADALATQSSLDAAQLQAVLWVTTNIMEDVCKLDLNSITSMGLYDIILLNTTDAVNLMAGSLSTHPEIHADCIACLQSWVCFALKAPGAHASMAESFSPLIHTIISSLTNEILFNASVELVVDILSDYQSLLSGPHYEHLSNLLLTPWARARFDRLLRVESDCESLLFGQLLLAFGEARAETLMRSCDSDSQQLLFILCGLLAAPGYPVTQNKIFVPAVEFWSTFAESVASLKPPDSEPDACSWTQMAISRVLEAVSLSWRKIAFPPIDEFNQWDSSERLGFIDARNDFVDLLQSAFALVGYRLVAIFVDLILSSLSASEWPLIEAAIFCLGGLADCCRDDGRTDEALAVVFSSSLFSTALIETSGAEFQAPQACLHLIEQYSEFFERNVDFIAPALRLLFALLRERSTALSASKSILKLCSSCRSHLHGEVEAFIDQYASIVNGHGLDCISAERIVGALASVAQAVPCTDRRYSACARIIMFIQFDAQQAVGLLPPSKYHASSCYDLTCRKTTPDEGPGLHACLRALSCLVSASKGFQSPCDTLVGLDANESVRSPCNDELLLLHQKILAMIMELETAFGKEAETMELICSILRCGFSESCPGPFVLESMIVAQYLTSHTPAPPRAGLLVKTACSFVNSPRYSRQSDQWHTIMSHLLMWVTTMLKQLSGNQTGPEDDPELSQNGIEFLSLLLAKAPRKLLELQPVEAAEFLFMFTIGVLDGRDPLAKGAAAEFWATFVCLGGSDEDVGLQRMINHAMTTFGPPLCQSLAKNLGGNASRSELVKLSEPVKKLASRHRMTKEWLLFGLNHSTFPSDKVGPEQKAMFVKKLLSLRGSRATTQVIRDFWLSARGSIFAYAS